MKASCCWLLAMALALAGGAAGASSGGSSERVLMEELAVPESAGPALLRVDHRGDVWVALAKRRAVLRIDRTTARQRIYDLPAGAFPVGVLPAKDGGVYFTDVGRSLIGRIDPSSGSIVETPLPNAGVWPFFLAETPDGMIWFTERFGNKIGRLDPKSRQILEIDVPTPAAQPAGLVADPRGGRLYFTENAGKKIGVLDTATLKVREFSVPSALKDPPYYGLSGIFAGANGEVWFCELDGRLGRGVWDPGSQMLAIAEYPLPNPQSRPGGVYVDAESRVWFTELDGNAIGYFKADRSGFVRYPLLSGGEDEEPKAPPETTARGEAAARDEAARARTTRPFGLFGSADGSIWFSLQYASAVGRLSLLPASAVGAERHPVAQRWSKSVAATATPLPGSRRAALYVENGDRLTWSSPDPLHPMLVDALGSAVQCQANCTTEGLRQGTFKGTSGLEVRVRPYQGVISEVALPARGRVPGVIDFDKASGAYWYTEVGGFPLPRIGHLPPGESIARYDARGDVRSYKTATPGSAPSSLKVDAEGTVWFTQQNTAKVGSYAPATGTMRDYELPDATSRPLGIAVDEARDLVWFTDKRNSRIGHVQRRTGNVTLFDTPSPNSEPSTIAVDRQGLVWFDQRSNDTLVSFDPQTRRFQTFGIPVKGARVIGVTPDQVEPHRLWFLELSGNALGRLDAATGKVDRYPLPNDGSFPFKLHQDRDGVVWITEVFGNRIAAFFDGAFLEFDVPTRNAMPGGISGDGQGTVTFSMQAADRIGHIHAIGRALHER